MIGWPVNPGKNPVRLMAAIEPFRWRGEKAKTFFAFCLARVIFLCSLFAVNFSRSSCARKFAEQIINVVILL
jgi:hypothetical protein